MWKLSYLCRGTIRNTMNILREAFRFASNGAAPIVFFGYSKSSIGEFTRPRFVYVDEERVKWIMDELEVIPQKEVTLFTPLSSVESVHPKVRVKKNIKAVK